MIPQSLPSLYFLKQEKYNDWVTVHRRMNRCMMERMAGVNK